MRLLDLLLILWLAILSWLVLMCMVNVGRLFELLKKVAEAGSELALGCLGVMHGGQTCDDADCDWCKRHAGPRRVK